MTKVRIINDETRAELIDEARKRRESICEDFAEALETEEIAFEFDKDNADPDAQREDYRSAATDGLAAILAEAGRAEAAAKRARAKAK